MSRPGVYLFKTGNFGKEDALDKPIQHCKNEGDSENGEGR
jgi:hypothetical protein